MQVYRFVTSIRTQVEHLQQELDALSRQGTEDARQLAGSHAQLVAAGEEARRRLEEDKALLEKEVRLQSACWVHVEAHKCRVPAGFTSRHTRCRAPAWFMSRHTKCRVPAGFMSRHTTCKMPVHWSSGKETRRKNDVGSDSYSSH
jgi:hypothetical protein